EQCLRQEHSPTGEPGLLRSSLTVPPSGNPPRGAPASGLRADGRSRRREVTLWRHRSQTTTGGEILQVPGGALPLQSGHHGSVQCSLIPRKVAMLASLSSPMSDRLLERLRCPDDQAAWAHFVERYTPLMVRWVRRLGLGSEEVADLLQDVL